MSMLIIVNLYQKIISKHCLLLIVYNVDIFISKFLLWPKSVSRYHEANIVMCIVSPGNYCCSPSQLLAKECALRTGKLPRRLAQEQCGKG